jgi:ABC-type bacteriocin/lantibiotic exporter with double-glycine peptidase domain
LNLQAIRRKLGVVLQSGAIFDGTILENINSGRHYSPEQVQESLYLIGADSFIQELPMGIHTVLTNGGMALSGGQRQLIMLARAIVGKPKILILDEATSSLDNHKQKIIYKHLSRLSMTQVIVAQRLDTIQHVDRIYVIDQGQIIDQGTFNELANKPGLFADLLHKAIS